MGSLPLDSASERCAYFTLVTSDSYVLPAAVLARSLRNTHTDIPFCVLATTDSLSKESLASLASIAHVVPVDTLSGSGANLAMIGRPDLRATLTKLHLWSQTQFRRILYLDADTLVLRNLDHLFAAVPEPVPFAACPELGFPDCFNSGVMLLRPDGKTHEDLIQFAGAAESFDGGDQGILNMYFGDGSRSLSGSSGYATPPRSPTSEAGAVVETGTEPAPTSKAPPRTWHRLSFTYNMEMHRVYRLYIPAALRYRDEHAVLHYIGKDKPWHFDGGEVPLGEEPAPYEVFYADMVKRWWHVRSSLGTEA